ncbi:hypothetical protein ACP70R_029842 [Stipagrostis hirtigluma subsp. patula]
MAAAVPMVRRCGGCDGRDDGAVEAMLQWQKVSDLLIAASLLSIPLELLYFATCAALAPLRRPLLQLGTFLLLCGATHLLNALSYDRPGSRRLLLALTAAKVLGAVASSAAAVSLPVFFPRLLRLKLRESFLRGKARQLDRDLAAVRRREDAAWRVARAVARHVRDAADARAVLRATMLQLAAALGLRDCAVWTPHSDGVLRLLHRLAQQALDVDDGSARAVSVRDPDVADVMASRDAKLLRPGSALEAASSQPPAGAAVAIRIPMLRLSALAGDGGSTSEPASYAILVLVRPPNDHHGGSSPAAWSSQDLEIVQAVADQVAVALSHAAALEESRLIRHKLAEQHGALLQARHELASATKARNSARGAMRDATRRPMHSVVGLLSVMQQETAMRPEQRLAVDAMARTSALSSTLMDDVMATLSTTTATDSGRDPPLASPRPVARRPFELRPLVRDAASVAGCLSGCRGIAFSQHLEANSLPEWVVGDDKRVLHLLLHMVDALMMSRRRHRHGAGSVLSFSVCSCNNIVGEDQDWIPARPNFSGGNQVFVKFQVELTRSPESDPTVSSPASRRPPPYSPGSGGADTQLSNAICQKIVQMMNGNMWSASDSEGLGETMTLVLRFQLQQSLNLHAPGSGTYRIGASPSTIPHFAGLRILLADGDAMSLEVTRKLLERLGCEVLPVPSAAVCLRLLGSAEPPPLQLVVLDLDAHGAGTDASAAGMDGFEVALRIRELSNTCWLLVLVALPATGVDDGVLDVCRRVGVNGVIQKPVTLPALGAQLQRVLHNN